MSEEKPTIGEFWCEGRDPCEGGWVFDETGASINGGDLEQATSREEAEKMGIPASVLDDFEKDERKYDEECGLFGWLTDTYADRFRPGDAPEGWDDY